MATTTVERNERELSFSFQTGGVHKKLWWCDVCSDVKGYLVNLDPTEQEEKRGLRPTVFGSEEEEPEEERRGDG